MTADAGGSADGAARSCQVCRSAAGFTEHRVPRYRHGSEGRDPIPYLECGTCGSLLIEEVPPGLDEEYGRAYHFPMGAPPNGGIGFALRRVRNRHAVTGDGALGRWLSRFFPPPLEGFPHLLRTAAPDRSDRILDVGAGTGELLAHLREAGYRDLTGVDPFWVEAGSPEPGIRMLRMGVEEMAAGRDAEEPFRLVMFNHSLEHVPDPEGALRAARCLLAPGGRVLVRTPVVPCLAWERFGTAWVQLDAPRHLTVFSRTGLPLLARRAGLELEDVRDDSTEIQFLGSELYLEGRPLHELGDRYGWRERRRRRKEARRLNARGRGDQAAFLFTARNGEAGP